jgi:ABC-2 type transport system ATP-binding protein
MIEIERLTKNFGSITAVSESTSREQGRGFAFGPNGAGKSTTMKMIAGYLTPSSTRLHLRPQT